MSENLQRRIAGIKQITDEVRSLMRYVNTKDQQQEIMNDFIKSDLFAQVFSPDKLHLQIVQRSQEVIKAYARQNKLSQEHIDLLWESTLTDETAQIEIYKVLQDSSGVIPDEVLEMFIKKIKD